MTTFEKILSTVTQQQLYSKYNTLSIGAQSQFIRYTSPEILTERIDKLTLQSPVNEVVSIAYIMENMNNNMLELRVDRFIRYLNGELKWDRTNTTARWQKTQSGYSLVEENLPAVPVIRQTIGDLVSHTPKCYYIANTGQNLTSIDWSWITIEGKVRTDQLLTNNVSYVCSVIRPVSSDSENTTIVECGTSCTENTVFLTDSPCLC